MRGDLFGIESGSTTVQRILNKKLNLIEDLSIVHEAAKVLDAVPVGMIGGAPGETRTDLEASMRISLDLKIRWIERAGINLLLPLTGTAMAHANRDRLELPITRESVPAFLQSAFELVAADVESFSYYYHLPTSLGSYEQVTRLFSAFNLIVLQFLPFTMAILVSQFGVDLIDLLDRWVESTKTGELDTLPHKVTSFTSFLMASYDGHLVNDLVRLDLAILSARANRGHLIEVGFGRDVEALVQAVRRGQRINAEARPAVIGFVADHRTQVVTMVRYDESALQSA